MTLTILELHIVLPLLDAGIKAAGLQVFQNDGGIHLQSALAKLQAMADIADADRAKKPKSDD